MFGVVDLMLAPVDRMHMWFIRYVVVCPTVTAGIAFTAPTLRRFRQLVISLVMLVGSLGIVAMVYFDPTDTKNFYYSGILLLIMGAFTFVSLRFWYALSWALVTTVTYEVVAIFHNHTDPKILTQNTFSIVSTIIIGAFSNYLMENYLRRDFLNSLLLEDEYRKLQKASAELHELSIADSVTNLKNRRYFDTRFSEEWRRAMRSETAVSVILVDVDFFKMYNDHYGHQAGDECLRLVADVIGGFAKRPGDVAARYGGEEFVLLLPDTDLHDAATIAETLRKAVENLHIPHQRSGVSADVTISAGAAVNFPKKETC